MYNSSPKIKWSKSLWYLNVVLCIFLTPSPSSFSGLTVVWCQLVPTINTCKMFFITVSNDNYKRLFLRKGTIVCSEARHHWSFPNTWEVRRHRWIEHHQNADIPRTDRFSHPVDECFKTFEKRGWLRNQMKTCHPELKCSKDKTSLKTLRRKN